MDMPRRLAVAALLAAVAAAPAAPPLGYYRQPSLHRNTLVFVSEGDLWQVAADGGVARRLTSHPGEEALPAISPDGKSVAFVGQFEGPTDVYVMPLAGGAPRRLTCDGGRISFVGWTPEGRVLIGTDAESGLPSQRLVRLDLSPADGSVKRSVVPLAEAADGAYSPDGKALVFTRLPFQGSHTRRYQGGTAQNLWRFADGDAEAVPLTASFKGTSKAPMWWQGRVYFVSDRDGTMNIWSMRPDGTGLKQHTRHKGWDVATPSLSEGRIAYQLGADLRLYDVAADADRAIPITLGSDFDQTRERWVKKPTDYLTAAHLSPDGNRVVLTARGQVFVAPVKEGRLVEASHKQGARRREARFFPDGKSLITLSDESGEVELWKLPANGSGAPERLTADGKVLRWQAIPSPDGKLIAHYDKDQRLYLYNVETRTDQLVDESPTADFEGLAWSPDSGWLAYVETGPNLFRRVKLLCARSGAVVFATSDRFDSFSPAWSPDGRWLYFLSDRNLKSVVEDPWGTYQPEPFLDKRTKVYQLALSRDGVRSPFEPPDELEKKDDDKKGESKGAPEVKIELRGLAARLYEVPAPPGNYTALAVNDKALFWVSTPAGDDAGDVQALAVGSDKPDVKTVAENVKSFEMSADGKKLLIRKGDDLYVVDADAAKADLDKAKLDLSAWAISVEPRAEWRQMFAEAWRLERDHFYDRGLHGVDWPAVRTKYEPLVERVASRTELSDLVAQMVSELGALHIFVQGGDVRKGPDDVPPASLGAALVRDPAGGGYRVERVYRSDPDEPDKLSPLARPGVRVKDGDVIVAVNGVPTLSAPDLGLLLRRQAGKPVLLRVRTKEGKEREAVVKPLGATAAADLRYTEWEYTRRLAVDELGKGQIGYVHLQAMGRDDFTAWAKAFYPVFTRQGLIVDVRHNKGGNIDSWIVGRLLRKPWAYWNQRVGAQPMWNMQYAFAGHVVVLCDQATASDGEAFCEGIKRLKLGTVIGTRTWGGGIWLNADNFLMDKGIATAAEFGVYGPEGKWMIEGHGVDPDIVVDNLPHATFKGKDAQLEAAVAHLLKRIEDDPVKTPKVPAFPRKK
jgi:tricorn protease